MDHIKKRASLNRLNIIRVKEKICIFISERKEIKFSNTLYSLHTFQVCTKKQRQINQLLFDYEITKIDLDCDQIMITI